ncbi:DUF2007 domain-containing protein [Gemmobacter caeni]
MFRRHSGADHGVHRLHIGGQPFAKAIMRFLCSLVQPHIAPVHPLDKRAFCRHCCDMKEILRSTDPTVIAFATTLLEGEGIAVFPLDVHMSILDGSLGILPQRLMVADRDLFIARAVLRDNEIDPGR